MSSIKHQYKDAIILTEMYVADILKNKFSTDFSLLLNTINPNIASNLSSNLVLPVK